MYDMRGCEIVSAQVCPPPPPTSHPPMFLRTRRVCVHVASVALFQLLRPTAASSLRAVELNIKRCYYIKHATCTRMQMGCRAHTVPPSCTLSLSRTHTRTLAHGGCEWRSLAPNGTGSNVSDIHVSSAD